MAPLRIMVVDDSAVCRKIVRDLLATVPDVEITATASNGKLALDAIETLRPDLITLDIEMPEIDGLGVLAEIQKRKLRVGSIMLSSLTQRGADMTMRALQAGAFDFVPKPTTANIDQSLAVLRTELLPKIEAFRRSAARGATPTATTSLPSVPVVRPGINDRVDVVAIGVSTGGPSALANLLPRLPGDLPVPIVIVQHMPPIFTQSLANDLNRVCKLEVREAAEGDVVSAGKVYIAPGGKQMKVMRVGTTVQVRITDDPPEKSCRPSVDYLFRSVSQTYGRRSLAIVLTGMGDDGLLGSKAIKNIGGTVLAQEQSTCVVYGMPRAIVENGVADGVVPLAGMPPQILRYVGATSVACP